MDTLLPDLIRFAEREQFIDTSFVVGGAVRDVIAGNTIRDVDVVSPRNALLTAKAFAVSASGTFVPLDERFGIARVAKAQRHIDFTTLRGDSITTDLSARDLTINAMAIPLRSFADALTATGGLPQRPGLSVVDPFGGRDDLLRRTVRMVTEDNLRQDPLRVLRVYRFATTLGFAVEIKTAQATESLGHLLTGVAVERIAAEVRHILAADAAFGALQDISRLGIMDHVFREWSGMSPDRRFAVLQSCRHGEHILKNLPLYFPDDHGPVSAYFSGTRQKVCLKFCLLLPARELCAAAAARLRLSGKEIDLIERLQGNYSKITDAEEPSTREVTRLLRNVKDDAYGVLLLVLAQQRVCQCQISDNTLLKTAQHILSRYHTQVLPRLISRPLITGDDLIREFGMTPSASFRTVLTTVRDMHLEGSINTREEALQAARTVLAEGRDDRGSLSEQPQRLSSDPKET